MILLDTHSWLWWLSDPSLLSAPAQEEIDRCMTKNAIHVSSISIWETALLVKKGRLELNRDLQSWIASAESLPFLRFVPIYNAIALLSVQLPEPFHSDPADRIIAATAIRLNCPLITKDQDMRQYPEIETIW